MSSDLSLRILIVRLSAIGDTVHSLPVLCALRDHLPHARIAWVVEQRSASVLQGHPALDELIVVPRRWYLRPHGILKMRRLLRAYRPQITIDVQGITKSALAARLSGAPVRYGPLGKDGRELSPWLNNRLVPQTARHVIDRSLQLLEPLGITRPEVRFDIPHRPEDDAAMARFIRERGLGAGFAILNPGASWASKRWPIEWFAAVARHLGRKHFLPTLITWAGSEEWTWADRIMTTSAGWAHPAPRTSLSELAELARRARLFVGNDTGPLHIASAVGTPCVGLFGPMPAERNGPYGPSHISLQNVRVSASKRSLRRMDNVSMRAISVEEVCAACDQLLDRRELEQEQDSWQSDRWLTAAAA